MGTERWDAVDQRSATIPEEGRPHVYPILGKRLLDRRLQAGTIKRASDSGSAGSGIVDKAWAARLSKKYFGSGIWPRSQQFFQFNRWNGRLDPLSRQPGRREGMWW